MQFCDTLKTLLFDCLDSIFWLSQKLILRYFAAAFLNKCISTLVENPMKFSVH